MKNKIKKIKINYTAIIPKAKKAGTLALIAFLVVSLVRNIVVVTTADRRIEEEEKRLEETRKKNEELKTKVAGIESQEYVEKQARDRLGLVKAGETIVVLPDEETLRKLAPKFEEPANTLPDPIWKKWMKLFI